MGLSIDPEFRDLIPRLSKDEYAGLEASIKAQGCHTRIVVWNGTIVDGHNRFKICTQHETPFGFVEQKFADRREARIWILDNQLSRRNLSEITRMDLALLMKTEVQAQAQERMKTAEKTGRGNKKPSPKSDEALRTDATLAAKAGVGKTKLREYGDVVASVTDAISDGRISPEEAARVRDEGEQLIAAVYAVILATERRATTIPLRPGTMAEAERKGTA